MTALTFTGTTPTAGVTTSSPLAQSVGRMVDGSVGGQPLHTLADLIEASAINPGLTSVQNPLDATLLHSLELPLTHALQLPTVAGIKLGAANQVAVANADGYSYGAAGAVANSAGASLGGTSAYPSGAEIDLDGAALNGLPTIGLPVGPALDALGAVKIKVDAVSAVAQTAAGGAAVPLGTNHYNIAGLSIAVASPALAGLLSQLTTQTSALTALLAPVTTLLGAQLPAS